MSRGKDIQDVIDAGGPFDPHELRRLALKATSRISDPATAGELQKRLLTVLEMLPVCKVLGPTVGLELRLMIENVLTDIEAASRPK